MCCKIILKLAVILLGLCVITGCGNDNGVLDNSNNVGNVGSAGNAIKAINEERDSAFMSAKRDAYSEQSSVIKHACGKVENALQKVVNYNVTGKNNIARNVTFILSYYNEIKNEIGSYNLCAYMEQYGRSSNEAGAVISEKLSEDVSDFLGAQDTNIHDVYDRILTAALYKKLYQNRVIDILGTPEYGEMPQLKYSEKVEYKSGDEIQEVYSEIVNSAYDEWEGENEKICDSVITHIADVVSYDAFSDGGMRKNLVYVMENYTNLAERIDEQNLLTFLYLRGVIDKDRYGFSDEFAYAEVAQFVWKKSWGNDSEPIDYSRQNAIKSRLKSEFVKQGLL
jgi:hypothetical protein